MTRPWHRIKPNKASQRPQKWLLFDTETTQEAINEAMLKEQILNNDLSISTDIKIEYELIEQAFSLGVGIYRESGRESRNAQRRVYRFDTVESFWKLVTSLPKSKEKLVVFCHNWKFDWLVIGRGEYLKSTGWINKRHIEGNGVFISIWKKDDSTLEFRDTLNYFKTTVDALGKVLGVEKLGEYSDHQTRDDLFTYCERDCEVLEAAIDWYVNYLDVNDLGNMKNTISSQALSAFTHRFMTHDIVVHNLDSVIGLERQSYKGGRTEAFHIGECLDGYYYGFDINSMYPHIMESCLLPNRLKYRRSSLSVNQLRDILRYDAVIAVVDVDTPEPCFGVRMDRKLKFPIGTYTTALCTPELIYGLDRGYIKRVYQTAVYEQQPLFQAYVREMYQLKVKYGLEGNKPFTDLSKRMLNHLYGKFGQRIRDWEKIGECDPTLYETKTVIDYETLSTHTIKYSDGYVWKRQGYNEGYNTMVAIPAHVTAYSRMLLWSMIKQAGVENVFYMDTDSLFVNDIGRENLLPLCHETELGKLKLEKESNHLWIGGAKIYDFGPTHKRKGIKSKAESLGGERYLQWSQVGSNEKLAKIYGNRCIWEKRLKTLSCNYDKGVITESGRIKPIECSGYVESH